MSPDKKISLFEYLLEKINGKIENPHCGLCGSSELELSNRYFPLVSMKQHNSNYQKLCSQRFFYYIPLTCGNCGNTYFIDLAAIGLIDAQGRLKENFSAPEGSVAENSTDESSLEEIQPARRELEEIIKGMETEQMDLKEKVDQLFNKFGY
jgi:hypothetical protein